MNISLNRVAIDPDQLAERFNMMQLEQPRLRIRDAAEQLNVSEMELLALGCGDNVVRLRANDFPRLIHRLPELGRVMSLTRNGSAVHERKGVFGNIKIQGAMGLVLNREIDLRLFMNRWAHAFVETRDTGSRSLTSLQFFDHEGQAIQKIYLTDDSDQDAFARILADYTAPDQNREVAVVAYDEQPDYADPADVDQDAFAGGWRGLKDVHHFFGLLRRHRLRRTDALRLIGPEFATRLQPSVTWDLLQKLAGTDFSFMVFVGNRGCIQIHTGPVTTLKRMDQWANILDPDFNLHLREDLVAEAWLVAKPTIDGLVHSLELYDPSGEVIAQFFSERQEGRTETPAWSELLKSLAELAA